MVLGDVNVPGPWPAIASVAPSVAESLERILEIERRLFRPDSHRLLAGLFEQDGKRRRADRRQFERQDLDQGVAVVNRPVGLVEVSGAVEEVAEARPFEAVLPPLDFGRRTAPSLALEDRQ